MSSDEHAALPMAETLGRLRRIITGENAQHRSLIMLEGPPANAAGDSIRSGLFEIWTEEILGKLDPQTLLDLAGAPLALSPDEGCVKARWFVVTPLPAHLPPERLKQAARSQFAALNASGDIADQDRHPFMHRTDTLDIVVLLKGSASLILDEQETRLAPGDVVIQRGAAHAWVAHDHPALFLAILIARDLARKRG